MSRPIRYCGDSENRNVRFVRQMARDGIPFGSPENAERIIGYGCAFGLVGVIEDIDALSELLNEIDGLMGESAGVYGLHLNGDPSPWSEIEEGGRFKRLSSMSKARAVLAKATGE